MRYRWSVNLGLLGVATTLAVAVWWSRGSPQAGLPTVSPIEPGAIERITIGTGDHTIRLTGDTPRQGWRIREPVSARASESRIAALIKLAAAPAIRRYARGAIGNAATHLAHPALIVRFNDGPPIAIGGPGPSPGSRYIRTTRALLVVATPDLGLESTGWPHWIAPDLIARDARLTRLDLPEYTLIRDPTTGWRITPAGAEPSPADAVASVRAWRHSRARSIEAADHARPAQAHVTLAFADRGKQRFGVIARTPELVLRDASLGVDYHLAANHARPLLALVHPGALHRANRPPAHSAIPLE